MLSAREAWVCEGFQETPWDQAVCVNDDSFVVADK
ncbi:MAG: hypothetical protein H6Q53_162, partial [Deltaproteobacteria bacterium]|nr:hypothetical protein [Deltaproteobacteria bacterium]